MIQRLSDIANTRSGYYTKPFHEGEVYYIQASDVLSKSLSELEPTILWDNSSEKHFLSLGDILLLSKGNNNTAFLYDMQVKPAVASSIFMTIRVKDPQVVLPAYLHWYLNLDHIQIALKRMSKGTRISSLSKRNLAELEIEVPDMQTQMTTVRLDQARRKQKDLHLEIDSLKEELLDAYLLNYIKERS